MARVFTWIPADGSTPITLNDRANGYRLMQAGTAGLHSPTYRMTTEQYAGFDGADLLALTADQRAVTLAVIIEATDEVTFRARWRALVRAMRPSAGDGQLQVRSEDGATRTLTCRYLSGLEGDGGDMFDGAQGGALIKLVAFDPWWFGPETTVTFNLGTAPIFLSTTLPMPRRLAASSIQAGQVIDLSGADTRTYPRWTITGPGSVLTLTNVTTGRTIQVNTTLAAGQSIVIDTRPGFQSVRRGDLPSTDPAWNLGGALATDPALWSLTEGPNMVTALLGSAGTDARITATYRPRYAGI